MGFQLELDFGSDTLSIVFLLLAWFLMGIVVLIVISTLISIKFYLLLTLSLYFHLLLVFFSLNTILFITCFEVILILMYFLVSNWGSKLYKIRSSFYLFIFTIFGSIFLLMNIILLLLITGSTNLIILENWHFNDNQQISFAILFIFSFGIKVPIFPFHIWLPEVHTETYTSGSIILAGILLKLAVYGLIRFTLFPTGIKYWSPYIFTLTVLGSIIPSINVLTHYELKKIIAYSSISHMNFAIGSWSTLNCFGNMACFFTSVAHGLSSTSLFIFAGFVYDRTHSINLQPLFNYMPIFSMWFLILIIANLSFPGTINFIGEFFSIISLGTIDLYLIGIFLLNLLLTTCYCFFTMSIVFLVAQARIQESYKDTNRIEFTFIILVFGIFY